MSIKLALLKSGESVISDAKELVSDDKVCGYLFQNPHIVSYRKPIVLTEEETSSGGNLEVSLSPWILLSKDNQIPVSPDWIVTIVEPVETLLQMFNEKVNGQSDQTDSSDEQRSLIE